MWSLVFLCLILLCVEGQAQTAASVCKDAQPDCAEYEYSACRGIYESWARVHCEKRCGFCGSPPPPTPPPLCEDKLPNCSEFQKNTCTNSFYHQWALDNCRKFCGFCQTSSHSGTPPDPHVVG